MEKLEDARRAGMFEIPALEAEESGQIVRIMKRFESISLQLTDAAFLHPAERERVNTIFTLDQRDFSIVRLNRNRAIRIIPGVEWSFHFEGVGRNSGGHAPIFTSPTPGFAITA